MSEIQPFRTRAMNVARGLLNVLSVFALAFAIGNVIRGFDYLIFYGSVDSGLTHLVPAVLVLPVVATINYLLFGRFVVWNRLKRASSRAEA